MCPVHLFLCPEMLHFRDRRHFINKLLKHGSTVIKKCKNLLKWYKDFEGNVRNTFRENISMHLFTERGILHERKQDGF
jgi:hypothetical protein